MFDSLQGHPNSIEVKGRITVKSYLSVLGFSQSQSGRITDASMALQKNAAGSIALEIVGVAYSVHRIDD